MCLVRLRKASNKHTETETALNVRERVSEKLELEHIDTHGEELWLGTLSFRYLPHVLSRLPSHEG